VGSAKLELVSGVALLREEDAVLEAMLEGWAKQQAGGRGLSAKTIGQRQAVVRQFLDHAGEYPWSWTAAHLDDWSADMTGVADKAKSTIRNYHDAIRSFESYLIAPQYRWAEECWARFGTHPARICFESSTTAHLVDYEGNPDRRPMTREELQRFFDYADDRVDAAARSGRKGALAAYRDATVFKVMYAWRRAAVQRDVEAGRHGLVPQCGGTGAGQVREAGSPLGEGVQGVAAAAAHGPDRDAVGGGGGRGLYGQRPASLRFPGQPGAVADRAGRPAAAPPDRGPVRRLPGRAEAAAGARTPLPAAFARDAPD